MRLTRAELAGLKRKQDQPTREPGELLAIFCPGKLENPLNGPPWVWQKRARYAQRWKDRVADGLLSVERNVVRDSVWTTVAGARLPKHITFLASTHNRMDSDGLQAALKPIRDALVDCRVLSGDADADGNTFEYHQRIDRVRRGVEIRVRLRP